MRNQNSDTTKSLNLYIKKQRIRQYSLPNENTNNYMWGLINKCKEYYNLKGKDYKFILKIKSKLK